MLWTFANAENICSIDALQAGADTKRIASSIKISETLFQFKLYNLTVEDTCASSRNLNLGKGQSAPKIT